MELDGRWRISAARLRVRRPRLAHRRGYSLGFGDGKPKRGRWWRACPFTNLEWEIFSDPCRNVPGLWRRDRCELLAEEELGVGGEQSAGEGQRLDAAAAGAGGGGDGVVGGQKQRIPRSGEEGGGFLELFGNVRGVVAEGEGEPVGGPEARKRGGMRNLTRMALT
jgi:hypothetical protein